MITVYWAHYVVVKSLIVVIPVNQIAVRENKKVGDAKLDLMINILWYLV